MKTKLSLISAFVGLILLARATPSQNTATEPLRFSYDFAGNPGVTNFTLYYGTTSGAYTAQVSSGLSTNVTVSGLTRNTTYFFAVTATDTNGLESDFSMEVQYHVPKKPDSPTQLTPL